MTHIHAPWRAEIGRSLVAAGLFCQGTIVIKALSPEYIGPDLSHRLFGVLGGALVIFMGNAIPKNLPRRGPRHPAAEQAKRRFTGWSLTLGGLGYMLAWMLAPIEHANGIAACFLGASFLVMSTQACSRLSIPGNGGPTTLSQGR
ncbi:MAG: hypothetical protein ABI672_21480 [Vicinamibacteria bacterium]